MLTSIYMKINDREGVHKDKAGFLTEDKREVIGRKSLPKRGRVWDPY